MKKIILITCTLALASMLYAVEPDIDKILSSIDMMSTIKKNDFSSVMTMVSDDPEDGRKVLKINQFRRDKDDKFLMLILEPTTQKGQGYLKIEDNLWFYDPESRKFSHTSFKENFQGSDAHNSDFNSRTYKEDYEVTSWEEGALGKYDVYILSLKAKNNEVTYPFQKIWVRKDNNLLLKMEDYSLNNRHMRTSFFPKYAKVGDKYLPTKMLFVDELTPGRKTQMTITNISLDALPDSVFSKIYVERVNR
ncbi:MAG: outer membrane lipoprotein-sorting protein, partial [Candidatus Pacearchaeota archaeon]|nr:outer membrane lipoprotein-sorting protein [Candidatus Pacearchaeota archaeon]